MLKFMNKVWRLKIRQMLQLRLTPLKSDRNEKKKTLLLSDIGCIDVLQNWHTPHLHMTFKV